VVADDPARSLHWQDVPDPACGPEEVLVDIHATAVNRADLLQRAGQYPPPPGAPPYLGLEMAGIIAEVGEQVGEWKPGDRVCGLLGGGGYAAQVAVHHQHLLPLPEDRDFTWGAAIPEVFLTAFVNLFMEAQLQKDESLLIHGGASGVGTAAIQLAHQAGCRVLVTAGTQEKVRRCLELGAEVALNYKELDFAQAILERLDGIDVILDIAGAGYLERNLRLLRSKGRLVFIALLTGHQAQVDLRQVMGKRLRLIGSVLRSRSIEEKSEIIHAFKKRFWHMLLDGRVRPVIHAVLPIERAEEAHQLLRENRNIGKVVLTIRQ
jgi:putative PIG3 family NAD(P)H quinone oxidoreductase